MSDMSGDLASLQDHSSCVTITVTVKEENLLLLLLKHCVGAVSVFPLGATKQQPVIDLIC